MDRPENALAPAAGGTGTEEAVTLQELKAKYQLSDAAKNEPNQECVHCGGRGERPIKSKPDKMTFCICLYVDHSNSDWAGTSLGQFARRELEKMRKP